MTLRQKHSAGESIGATDSKERLSVQGLVNEHASAVLGMCIAHTRSIHDAEDVAQEVLLRACAKIGSLREPSSARAWLLQIARRLCIDHYRKTRPDGQLNENIAAPEAGLSDAAAALHAAIARLPESQREAIALYYMDGRKCSSIAAALGVSEEAVRTRLMRARLKLHDLLSEGQK